MPKTTCQLTDKTTNKPVEFQMVFSTELPPVGTFITYGGNKYEIQDYTFNIEKRGNEYFPTTITVTCI